MPSDREETLKKAEKLLRQGKLEGAIAEYLRIVEAQPADWATANTLGDLFVKAGQPDKAAAQYGRIAEHFMVEGFFPKASALYKKLLKLTPDDEVAQLNLAEISQKQGLLADAKARLNAVAARRKGRGDRAGAAEIVVLLGALDPADFEARAAGARTLAEMGRTEEAAARFRAMHDDLVEKERPKEALDALRQSFELNPDDHDARAMLAKATLEAGDVAGAARFLDRETAGDDPALQLALLEMELKAGRLDAARDLLRSLFAGGSPRSQQVVDLAWALAGSNPDAAFLIVDAAAEAAAARSDFGDAAAVLQEFVARVPRQIPALLKLVDVCVEGGLERAMYETQAELADAYLATGQAVEARMIAEDLVAREPWERAHIERFRRALVMLKIHDPDTLIAQRLGGQEPFTAKDPFAPATTPFQEAELPEAAPDHVDEAEGGPAPGPAVAEDPPGEAEVPAEAPPAAVAVSADAEPEVDLSSQLGAPNSLAGSGSDEAFAQVFGRPGGSATSDGDSDSSGEDMSLGRTYVEMGMPAEAIAPLKAASEATRFRFEAASMLGRIYGERGEIPQAIEWLERAAEAPAPSAGEEHDLLYELGLLVEQSGDTSRALAVFLELQSEAGPYRDVAERVERLARVETGG